MTERTKFPTIGGSGSRVKASIVGSESRIEIDGVDVTNSVRSMTVWVEAGDITTVDLSMYPGTVEIEGVVENVDDQPERKMPHPLGPST